MFSRIWIFLLLFNLLVGLPVWPQGLAVWPVPDTVKGGQTQAEVQPSNTECIWYLKQLRQDLLISLDQRLKEVTQRKICLLGGPLAETSICQDVKKDVLKQIEFLREHRQNQASVDMLFMQGGFQLRSNSSSIGTGQNGNLVIVSGGLSNGLSQRMSSLSEEEKSVAWHKHKESLSEFLRDTWWPQQQNKFPQWKNCLETKDDKIELNENSMHYEMTFDRPVDKHLLFPKFKKKTQCVSIKDRECRTTELECRKIWDTWTSLSYGSDYDRFRQRRDSVKDGLHKKNIAPWAYNITSAIPEKDEKEKLRLAYMAHEKLEIQIKNLRKWAAGLKDYQRTILLEFQEEKTEVCRNYERKGWSSLFCDDHGVKVTSSRLVDECMLSFLPTSVGISLLKDIRNNETYIAGMKTKGAWQEKHDENMKEVGRGVVYGAPLSVAGGAAGKVAFNAAKPVVKKYGRKVLDRVRGPIVKVADGLLEPVKKLSREEGYSLLKQANVSGKGKDDIKDEIIAKGLAPTRTVKLSDGTSYHLSEIFEVGGRPAVFAVVEKDGKSTLQVFYQSMSNGSFRNLPGIMIRDKGGQWYDKGINESSLELPNQVEEVIANSLISQESKKTSVSDKLIQNVVPTYRQHERPLIQAASAAHQVTSRRLLQRTLGPTQNPSQIVLKNAGHKVDFSKPPLSTYKVTTINGSVTAKVYRSKNDEIEYTIFEDTEGKIQVAKVIDLTAEVNEAGIRGKSFDAGNLVMPRWESPDQVPATFVKPEERNASHVDTWNYLKEIPFIQDYYKAQGKAVPEAVIQNAVVENEARGISEKTLQNFSDLGLSAKKLSSEKSNNFTLKWRGEPKSPQLKQLKALQDRYGFEIQLDRGDNTLLTFDPGKKPILKVGPDFFKDPKLTDSALRTIEKQIETRKLASEAGYSTSGMMNVSDRGVELMVSKGNKTQLAQWTNNLWSRSQAVYLHDDTFTPEMLKANQVAIFKGNRVLLHSSALKNPAKLKITLENRVASMNSEFEKMGFQVSQKSKKNSMGIYSIDIKDSASGPVAQIIRDIRAKSGLEIEYVPGAKTLVNVIDDKQVLVVGEDFFKDPERSLSALRLLKPHVEINSQLREAGFQPNTYMSPERVNLIPKAEPFTGAKTDLTTAKSKYHLGDLENGKEKIGEKTDWAVEDVKVGDKVKSPIRNDSNLIEEMRDGANGERFIQVASPSGEKSYYRIGSESRGRVKAQLVDQKQTPFKEPLYKYVESKATSNLKKSWSTKSLSTNELAKRITEGQRYLSNTVIRVGDTALLNAYKMNQKVVTKFKESSPLTVNDLKAWNAQAINGISNAQESKVQNVGGVVRGTAEKISVDGQEHTIDATKLNVVGGYGEKKVSFVDASLVPGRLNTLVENVNRLSEKSNLVDVAKIVQDYIRVHPFNDGNGRTAMGLTNYMLMRAGYPPLNSKNMFEPGKIIYQTPDEFARELEKNLVPQVDP